MCGATKISYGNLAEHQNFSRSKYEQDTPIMHITIPPIKRVIRVYLDSIPTTFNVFMAIANTTKSSSIKKSM